MLAFKGIFTNLLVETAADFSSRSVPQFNIVGPMFGSSNICGEVIQAKASLIAEDNLFVLPPQLTILKRTKSSELRRALEVADAIAQPVWARQTSEDIVRRFANMTSWEDSDHPIALFNMDTNDRADSCRVISLNSACLEKHAPSDVRSRLLDVQGIDMFSKDWRKVTNDEAVEILRRADGLQKDNGSNANIGGIEGMEPGYILTVDNMLKMISIQLRLSFNLPVIIMGETGNP